jgi:hypothetical protein
MDYLKFLYKPVVLFELKGVKILNVVSNEQLQNVNDSDNI